MLDLIKTSESKSLVNAINARSGATSVRLKTAKEYKDERKKLFPNETAKARKEAFEAYTRTAANELMAAVDHAKLLKLAAEGKLGMKRVTANRDGTTLTTVYVDLSAAGEEAIIREKIQKIDTETARKLLEHLQERLGKVDDMSNHTGEQ